MADDTVIIPAIELKPNEEVVRLGPEGMRFRGNDEVTDGWVIVDINHFQRSRDDKMSYKGFLMINGCVVKGFIIDKDQSRGMIMDNSNIYGFPMQATSLQQLADILYGVGAIPHQVQGTGAEKVISVLQERIADQKEMINKLHQVIIEMIADKTTNSEIRTRLMSL